MRHEPDFPTITFGELDRVCGGAAKKSDPVWDAYVAGERKRIKKDYNRVVCTTTGVKGGPPMAEQTYGKPRTTNADRIRAAQTLTGICNTGDHLPEGAPEYPF